MTTQKLTITLPAEMIDSIKQAVAEGKAASVSAFIAEAMRRQAERNPLDLLIADMIAEHGEPSPEDFAAVERLLAAAREYAAGHAA